MSVTTTICLLACHHSSFIFKLILTTTLFVFKFQTSHFSSPMSEKHAFSLDSNIDYNKTNPDEKKTKKNRFAMACAILASMSSILLGYDVGVMTGAVIYIKKDMKIDDTKVEILVGILSFYCLVGAAAAGPTSDRIGRRYTISVAGAIFFGGALVMGLAKNYAFLMVGRGVAGIGVGYALMIAPVYTAELSPASIRGFLSSLPEVFINFGILLGYVSNYSFSKLPTHLGWRFMLGIGVIPSIFLIGAGLSMPESPRWLVLQGRLLDAKHVLHKTSDSITDANTRLSDIMYAAGIPPNCTDDIVPPPKKGHTSGDSWADLLLRPSPCVRRMLLAGVGILFFQQSCGINSVVSYSPRIFEKTGIHDDNDKLVATMALGAVKTGFILVATFLLDRVGRRPLLLGSVGGVVVTLVSLGAALTVIEKSEEKQKWAVVLCVVSLLCMVACFSMGLGPVAWVYSSEIFPLKLRSKGTAVAVAVSSLTSGVYGMTFISLYNAITIGGTFFLYSGIMFIAWFFFFAFLPETRGRTLEEMEAVFGSS